MCPAVWPWPAPSGDMADIERRLLSAAFMKRNILALIDAGITEEFFVSAEHTKVFTWGKRYWQKHRITPDWRRVEQQFPGYRVLQKLSDPLDDYIEQVKEAHHTRLMIDMIKTGTELLDTDDPNPMAAQEAMQAVLRRASLDVASMKESRLSDVLGDYVESLFSRDPNRRLLGLATGFEAIDDVTLGLQPQQLITLMGTPKAGKSSAMMVMATNVQFQGNDVYFVSFEMSAEEQYTRYIAMGAQVDYHKLVLNKLDSGEKKEVRKFLAQMKEAGEFIVCADVARASTVSGLEAKLVQAAPKAVFIDGMYLMRDEETGLAGSDWKALTNLTRDMKKMAQNLDIPIMVSTQALMSKAASRNRKNGHYRLDGESPGYSSSWAQDSDVLMAIEKQNDRPDERVVRVIFARNCQPKEIRVDWNWTYGLFGTPVKEDGSEYDEDEDD